MRLESIAAVVVAIAVAACDAPRVTTTATPTTRPTPASERSSTMQTATRPSEPSSKATTKPRAAVPDRGLVLEISSEPATPHAGDTVVIRESLRNISDRSIWANFRSFQEDAERVGMFKEFGELVRTPPEPIWFGETEPTFPAMRWSSKHYASEIKPGETDSDEFKVRIAQPGVYRFSARWSSWYAADGDEHIIWQGDLKSNQLDVTVKPATETTPDP